MTMRGVNTEDTDRVYCVDTNWLRSNVVRLPEESPTRFDLQPTSDPEKYVMRISGPMPRFLIKTANVDRLACLKTE
jgi:hypothetical protein